MARLALTVAGAAAGLALAGPLGITAALGFGIGSMVGGIAGSLIFPPELEDQVGPRVSDLKFQASTYGSPITKLYGTSRLAGQIVWTSGIKEIPIETEVGGKGGLSQSATQTTFMYKASFSVGICAGVDGIKLFKIWADSKLIYDTASTNKKLIKPVGMNFRFYDGNENQEEDPTEASYEGTGTIPAYRGLCRIVFEDLDLTPYGGRYPNFNFEVGPGTDSSPYEVFGLLSDVWGATQNLRIDSTDTYLYTMVDNCFSIINMIDNSMVIFNYTPTEGHYGGGITLNDITDSGGWVCAREIFDGFSTHLLFGRTDQLVRNFAFVISPEGYPMLYPGHADQSIHCGIYYWIKAGGVLGNGLYKVAEGLTPLHPYYTAGLWAYAEPSVYPVAGENFKCCVHAPMITHDGEDLRYVLLSVSANNVTQESTLYIEEYPHDISANTHDAVAIGYEIDNGWIYIGSSEVGHGIDIYDSDVTFIKNIPVDCGISSPLLNIRNHRLWVNSGPAVGDLTEINTLTGDIIRTLNIASWDAISTIGGMVYDPISNALWLTSPAPKGLYKLLLDRADPTHIHLWEIVQDICNQVDITNAEMDVTELTDEVWGYSIDQRMSARAAIEPLQIAYFFDGVESDAKIKFLKRELRTNTVTIDHTDLACHDPGAEVPDTISHSRQQELELPKTLEVLYPDPTKDYQQQTQRCGRLVTESDEFKTVTLPINIQANEAKQISEKLLYLMWLERNRQRWWTYRKYAYLDNCDAITLTNRDGNTYFVRITKMEHGGQGLLSCESVLHDLSTYVSTSTGVSGKWYVPAAIDYFGPTNFYFMDIPYFRDVDDGYRPEGFYVALSPTVLTGWRGAILYKSPDRTNFTANVTGIHGAKQGMMLDALVAIENPGTWDRASVVDVQLFNDDDTLSSATEDQVLNGANACVIGFEICQFCTATLVTSSPKVYTLSNFLRGRRGTEAYIYAHAAGERFVFVTATTIYRSDLDISEIGIERFYSIATLGTKLDTSKQVSYHGYAAGLKPLSPVHVEKSYNDANDCEITWIRRTRIGGAWRDLVDVPLGEKTESYQLDIYDDAMTFLRTEEMTSATYTYTAAEQTADGIVPGDPIKLHVYQMSEIVGRGFMGGDGVDFPPELAQVLPPVTVPVGDTFFDLNNVTWQSPLTFNLDSGHSAIGKFYMDNYWNHKIWKVNPILFSVSGTINYVFTFQGTYTVSGNIATGESVDIDISSFDVAGVADPVHGFVPVTGEFKLVLTSAAAATVRIQEVKVWGWP